MHTTINLYTLPRWISIDHTQIFDLWLVYGYTTGPCCLGSVHVDSYAPDYLSIIPGTGPAGSWPAMWAALVSPVPSLAWLKPGTWRWKALYLVIKSLSHLVSASLCDVTVLLTAWAQFDLLAKLNSILPQWCQYFLGLKKKNTGRAATASLTG